MLKRILPVVLLFAYLFVLIKVLVLKDLAMIRIGILKLNFGGTQEGAANLIPFKTILYYLQGHNGFLIACINIVGNIAALVPLGFLLPLVFSNMNWKKTLLVAIGSGLSIELVQVYLHIGIFDIDDVILNGLGVIIGFGKFKLYNRFSIKSKTIISGFVLTFLGAITLLYAFSYYKIISLPIGIEPAIERDPLPQIIKNANGTAECCDLCNGTGGTGEIELIGTNAITIKGRKGTAELIKLTPKTVIKNSNGVITQATLKMGDHVTVIIDESETASLVLVCGIAKMK